MSRSTFSHGVQRLAVDEPPVVVDVRAALRVRPKTWRTSPPGSGRRSRAGGTCRRSRAGRPRRASPGSAAARPRRSRCVHVALQQLVLQLLEERRLVVAQLRLDPVLRVQEDLAVRLPHPVALHPLPVAPVDVDLRVRRATSRLEVQQAALHEQLDRADRLLDPRGQPCTGPSRRRSGSAAYRSSASRQRARGRGPDAPRGRRRARRAAARAARRAAAWRSSSHSAAS